ncbi:copper chaperone PCu(A)C [Agaribacter marinus]|uniref:Copper chaperone PCu(A)C n=1 Tax=Agaribacter marinus TaxID=1431249 RepID=A0AA37SZQ9_9ALTE|nr:copper chaperone PCu(A)C [Agaribacter marinus]GLR72426.1 hypothetical protein GCM10007852_33340 [Agaribacter marinus]
MKVIKKHQCIHSIYTLLSSLALFFVVNVAFASDQKNTSFKMSEHAEISQNWSRETFKFAKTGAAYFTIFNTHHASTLVLSHAAVDQNIASMVQIHETVMEDEIMSMMEVETGVKILPQQTVNFLPGGKHLMFMGLEKPFTKGDSVSVVLHFEDGSSLPIELPVVDVRQ